MCYDSKKLFSDKSRLVNGGKGGVDLSANGGRNRQTVDNYGNKHNLRNFENLGDNFGRNVTHFMEKKIKRRERSVAALREIISVCESKETREIFFSCETYTRGFTIVYGKSQVRHKL